MTWVEHIGNQLQDKPFDRPREIEAMEGRFRVKVTLSDWDRLGCLLKRIDLKTVDGKSFRLDPGQIEQKVTYLGETLKVIEKEDSLGRVILRSLPPREGKDFISFFEMTLDRDDGLSLIRYAYHRGRGERLSVAAPLTRDSLERFLTDLIQSIPEN